MVELGHPLSTHIMLAEKQRFYFIILQIQSIKHIKTLAVLGVLGHIISITYRMYKYYEKKLPRYLTAN